MQRLKFEVGSFEGPLDLLLILIKKNKVSIYDIPIAEILDQYLEIMTSMQEQDLELSSEFLVLAATLLQIKSKMLLPKPEEDEEEGEDPREELVRKLLEYKKIKKVVPFLDERKNIGATRFYKLPDIIEPPPAEYNYASLTPENLLAGYKRAFQRLERRQPPSKQSFEGIVGHEKVSIRSKVKKIWTSLKLKSKTLFKDIFKGTKTRAEAVASFLAVLELVKLNRINVEYGEDGDYSNPMIYKNDNSQVFEVEKIED